MTIDEARDVLERNGQGQLLRFWGELDADQRRRLLDQIASLEWSSIGRMKQLLESKAGGASALPIEPAPVISVAAGDRAAVAGEGEAAIRAGKVGVILVAGGQGSRLGYEGPKGCFEVGPISGASLFEIHARKILALERKYGAAVPFYIMTSQANDAPTRKFFEANGHFGLTATRVLFFTQGMWPALDAEGKLVLEQKDRLFMSPDGHGGILSALRVTGMLDDMTSRGLETLFYFQVDNPLVEIADPAFIGLHRRHRSQISVKVCAKRDPDEGLGVVVLRGGRSTVVEYTELTKEQKHARLPGGELKFRFGSVAIHVFSLKFLRQEASAALPLHVAHKKVPFCDASGCLVKPDKPNAYKFEKFIFDVLPDAERAINVEFRREDEFSPVKNAQAPDSPETAKRDMIMKAARWLESCGVKVPRDGSGAPACRIEIDPCYALGPDDLKAKLPAGFRLERDVFLGERGG